MRTFPRVLHPCSVLLVTAGLLLTALGVRANAGGSNSFAGAPNIPSTFYQDTVTDLTNFTTEAGEPLHGDATNYGKTAWWRWTAPTSGFCTVATKPTSDLADTIIAVYTGSAVNSLTRIASGDDTAASRLASATFYATAGSTYRIAVDGTGIFGPDEAQLTLRHFAEGPRHFIGTWESPNQNTGTAANGSFAINITASGAASGYIVAGTVRYPFLTQLTNDAFLHVSIPREVPAGSPPLPPLTMSVDVTLTSNLSTVYGGFSFSDGLSVHGIGFLDTVDRFTKVSPCPVAGRYNAIMGFPNTSGLGFARILIKPSGSATLVGVAGDGRKLSLGTRQANTNLLPVHQGFSGGKGFFHGEILTFSAAPIHLQAASSNLSYRRPAGSGAFYPTGLLSALSLYARPYTAPAAGQRAMDFLKASSGAGKLTTTDAPGELSALTEALTFTKANKFIFSSAARKPALSLDTATGLVSGSIESPAGTTRKIRGIVCDVGGGAIRVRGMVSGGTRTAVFEVGP